ncbi:MAG: type II secretion system protein [Candidatus Izemoplasmatales bacterium]
MIENRRGVTLPELLGAIVILAIVTSLLGAVAFAMVRAIDRIAVNQSAEATGLYLVDYLEDAMADRAPNAYDDSCAGTGGCVVLIQEYAYAYDPVDGSIDAVVHVPPLETEFSIHDDAVWINGASVDAGDFTIGSDASLSVNDVLGSVTVTIAFSLVAADGRTFPFFAEYRFTVSEIPA